ncbi:fumarylacetoacetate hydrolase family protein [Streptomyces sp. 4503]|uniref:Fumarylacetoacetate hydrolase family protein n=1 Tax=Streptomyces niphimycinicus TaxID=2842201 RepID=A0ABS6C6T7_9ACTN|nr:fumarylacetoacetate hydrolase family protein [Streptomyces niphimycinicus]MBU3862608.1 fumarylacetoacetate hydrolase family protein [Streptomyces niphimycinicus]
MKLVRWRTSDGTTKVGVHEDEYLVELPFSTMAEVLQHKVADIRRAVEEAVSSGRRVGSAAAELLAPVDGRTEVWGAGVTYQLSRSARAEESGFEEIYHHVYEADRPELFFKSAAWRVLTDGDPGGLRPDCDDSVCEPELALVLNRHAEIVGALVCNDLTARGIEAVNPIYLPQAKLFPGGCVLSTAIAPWWSIDTPEDLLITMAVYRGPELVFSGETRTSAMRRQYGELVQWLFRGEQFPDGVVLSTGTGIVPPLGEGLRPGDRVIVTIDQVGTLSNVMTDDRDMFEELPR